MWKFWLLILTVTVSGCNSIAPWLREAAIDSQVTQARTASKIWRVKAGSVYDGDTFRAVIETIT